MAGEGGPAARAVGHHLELLVQQALVMDRLQRPPHRLDVVGIQRSVGVVEVDPEADPLGQPVPVLQVAEHRLPAAGVELRDPVALDVLLGLHPQLGLHGQLDRKAVAVPAALALDVVAAHGAIAGEDVLEHPAEHVVGGGGAVGGGRPFVEAPLRRAGAPPDRLGEHLALAPAREHGFLERRKRLAWIYGAMRGGHGRGILGTPASANRWLGLPRRAGRVRLRLRHGANA